MINDIWYNNNLQIWVINGIVESYKDLGKYSDNQKKYSGWNLGEVIQYDEMEKLELKND